MRKSVGCSMAKTSSPKENEMEVSTIHPQKACSMRIKGDPRSYLRVEYRGVAVWYQLTTIGYELLRLDQTNRLEEAFLAERRHHVAFAA